MGVLKLKLILHTFRGIIHEESLKQLVLDGDLISWVVGKNIFMANIIQTCPKKQKQRENTIENSKLQIATKNTMLWKIPVRVKKVTNKIGGTVGYFRLPWGALSFPIIKCSTWNSVKCPAIIMIGKKRHRLRLWSLRLWIKQRNGEN